MAKLKNIDKNIKKLITKLNRNNLITFFSCQGHNKPAYILFKSKLTNNELAKATEIIEEFTQVPFDIKTQRIRRPPNTSILKNTTLFAFVGPIK